MYYFEPTQTALSEGRIAQTLGKELLSYSAERQAEVGLYRILNPQTPFNPYESKIVGESYTKYNDFNDFTAQYPGFEPSFIEEPDVPVYAKEWVLASLDPADEEDQDIILASEYKVLNMRDQKLGEVTGFVVEAQRRGHNISAALATYINALTNIETDPDYPGVLAYDLNAWPSKPDDDMMFDEADDTAPLNCYTRAQIDAMLGNTTSETNADIAFRRIVLSYSIPGSYPEKVTAMDNAVATYTVNGDVEDLYNAAVAELTA